jgi:hypothetical protein
MNYKQASNAFHIFSLSLYSKLPALVSCPNEQCLQNITHCSARLNGAQYSIHLTNLNVSHFKMV